MSTIGTRVRELRRSKGLTQQALAGDGISAGYVSLIESGKRVPSEDVVRRLADRLGVDFETLNRDEEAGLVTDQALLEMNFARMALANGNPAEAVRCLNGLMLRGLLDSSTACDVALVLAEALGVPGQLDEAVKTLESLVARCRREESWLVLGTAAASLVMMYVESSDSDRAHGRDDAGRDRGSRSRGHRRAHPARGRLRLGLLRAWRPALRLAPRPGAHRRRRPAGAARVPADPSTGTPRWWRTVVAASGTPCGSPSAPSRSWASRTASRDLPRLRLHYAWLLLNGRVPPRPAMPHRRARPRPVRPGPPGSPDGPRAGCHAPCGDSAHLILGEFDDAAEHAAARCSCLGPPTT